MSLHHGDCLEVMAAMEPESVDAVVTDPPYGLGFMGKAWDMPGAFVERKARRAADGFDGVGGNHHPVEPIVMARKPGPLRMLAIDACRIGMSDEDRAVVDVRSGGQSQMGTWQGPPVAREIGERFTSDLAGRWPANVILTDPIFDGGWEGVVGGGEAPSAGRYLDVETPSEEGSRGGLGKAGSSHLAGLADGRKSNTYANDSGTYSRFFILPKADRADREPVLGGLPTGPSPHDGHFRAEGRSLVDGEWVGTGTANRRTRANSHPTVKPVDLMRHLVRLVTPTGGIVLDPFGGSGTTALACELEGFPWILIEKEAEYVAIAEARLNGVQRGLGLPA